MAKPTELFIYGDIGDSPWFDGIGVNDVRLQLKELDPKASAQTIHINSTGGRADIGLAMMNLLRSHKDGMKVINPDFKLNAVNDGYCMSAATLPFMACDNRIMALGSIFMVHDALNYVMGNAKELRKAADDLDVLSSAVADAYALLTAPMSDGKKDSAYYRTLMSDETYLNAETAVSQGFATATDKNLEAIMVATLTPEIMKGKYSELMTTRYEKRTFLRPKPNVGDRGGMLKELSLLALELGQKPFFKV